MYLLFAIGVTLSLVFYVAPKYGTSHIFVFIGICSLVGSLSVMSCKVLTRASPFPHLLWPSGHCPPVLQPDLFCLFVPRQVITQNRLTRMFVPW